MNLKIDKEVSEETHKKIMELLEADNKWPVLWRADDQHTYHTLDNNLEPVEYADFFKNLDDDAYALGLYAKTKEELQAYLDYLKAFTRLSVIGDEVDWQNAWQLKYVVILNHETEELEINTAYVIQVSNMPHFLTKERAEQSMKDFQKEYITCLTFKREGV